MELFKPIDWLNNLALALVPALEGPADEHGENEKKMEAGVSHQFTVGCRYHRPICF